MFGRWLHEKKIVGLSPPPGTSKGALELLNLPSFVCQNLLLTPSSFNELRHIQCLNDFAVAVAWNIPSFKLRSAYPLFCALSRYLLHVSGVPVVLPLLPTIDSVHLAAILIAIDTTPSLLDLRSVLEVISNLPSRALIEAVAINPVIE